MRVSSLSDLGAASLRGVSEIPLAVQLNRAKTPESHVIRGFKGVRRMHFWTLWEPADTRASTRPLIRWLEAALRHLKSAPPTVSGTAP